MGETRKLSVEVPEEVLESALASTDQGTTQTVRRGLELAARSHRPRLADAFISQSCIDHAVRLATRDHDFRHFARLGGLRLAV
ncbi:MAG: type II toxin-antitoxin system VapC family toxin [Myxococcota bacterium]